MIDRLCPSAVVGVEAFHDSPDLDLFPSEEVEIARAVQSRRLEYATARRCARTALARLGMPPTPILRGDSGAPRWPAGIVGSMTHCKGYRAAALARDSEVRTIGLDAEPNQVLPVGVLKAVSSPSERDRLVRLSASDPGIAWDRLLFCAKEAVYKAWFPLAGRWLGFQDAEVSFAVQDGTFTAHLRTAGPVSGFTGRWNVHRGLMGTAICVPA